MRAFFPHPIPCLVAGRVLAKPERTQRGSQSLITNRPFLVLVLLGGLTLQKD